MSRRFSHRVSRHSSLNRSTPPNSKEARRRASSLGSPAATYSATCCSTWNCSSESSRRSVSDLCQSRRSQRMASLLVRGLEDQRNGVGKPLPVQHLSFELGPAFPRQLVKLRLAARAGVLPLRFQPGALLEPVQRGIKGPLRNLKEVFGYLLNPLGDSVAVNGAASHHLENQHVESPLEELCFFLRHRRHLVILPV